MADAEVLPERYDPFSPAALDDPYPFYEDLRRSTPVAWLPANGIWVLTRYDDIVRAWNDHAALSSAGGAEAARSRFLETGRADGDERTAVPRVSTGRSLIASDPPLHTKLRQLTTAIFDPSRLSLLGRDVGLLCQRLVDDLLERPAGSQDLVAHLARPLPVLVVARLLGVPLGRAGDLLRWGDELNGLRPVDTDTHTPDELLRMRLRYEMWDFFDDLVRSREADPGADAVSHLIASVPTGPGPRAAGPLSGGARPAGGDGPTRDDLIDLASLLLIAAGATTTGLLANLLQLLLARPHHLDTLRADPTLIDPTIDEALRFDPPTQGLFRWTTGAVRFGDVVVPANQPVWGILASANRDETRFSRPNLFDPTRRPNPHLGFGWGPHQCVGQPLARLTARAVLEALAARTVRLSPDGTPLRAGNPVLRTLAALPVRVVAR